MSHLAREPEWKRVEQIGTSDNKRMRVEYITCECMGSMVAYKITIMDESKALCSMPQPLFHNHHSYSNWRHQHHVRILCLWHWSGWEFKLVHPSVFHNYNNAWRQSNHALCTPTTVCIFINLPLQSSSCYSCIKWSLRLRWSSEATQASSILADVT